MTVQKTVVRALDDLSEAGVAQCVLRNYGFVEGDPIEGDVDVLVDERHRDRVVETLLDHGFRPREGDTTRQTAFERFVAEAATWVVIDVYWDAPTYNGLPILDGERTLDNRRLHPALESADERVYVPHKEEYFVHLVFHGALNKNGYRASYRDELRRLRTSVDREPVLRHGEDLFGRPGRQAMARALDGRFEDVVGMKWRLVRGGVLNDPVKVPVLAWNLILLREVARPLRSSLGSSAPVVAILGPDGSGKTTTAERVADTLSASGIDSSVAQLGVYNGETAFLGTLKALRNRLVAHVDGSGTESVSKRDATGTDGASRQRSIGSRRPPPLAAVHLLDIWLRLRVARSGDDVVVADRYAHDVLLYDDPGPIRGLLRWFERPPFLGVVLEGPAEEIAARSEYDEGSVATMYERLTELESERFVRVDATQPPDEVVSDVLRELDERGTLGR